MRKGKIIPRFTSDRASFSAEELLALFDSVYEHVNEGYGSAAEGLEAYLYEISPEHPLLRKED